MNLRQIEVFRAVMVAGSVTDAARLLHVSQPGVSRMLAHIELQLGLPLFERRKGRLLPTPEARELHAEVEQVYRGVRRIRERATALKDGTGLSLRVLASPSTGLDMVPQAVASLAAEDPSSRIYLEIAPAREMVNQLVIGEADVAISTLPVDHALLASRVLGRWSMACVFPKGHALGARRTLGPRDVLRERLIAFSPDTPQGRLVAEWCARHRLAPAATVEVRAGQTACALAAAGAGVAIVDDLTARACRTDKLDFRPIARSPAFEILAVTNAGVALSRLGQAFVARAETALRRLRAAPA